MSVGTVGIVLTVVGSIRGSEAMESAGLRTLGLAGAGVMLGWLLLAMWHRCYWGLIVLGTVGVVLMVTGNIRGSHAMELAGLLPFGVAGAGIVLGWLRLAITAFRKRDPWKVWLVKLLIATVYWCIPVVAFYLVLWRPSRVFRDEGFYESASAAEIRSACHCTLLWSSNPHDEFIRLGHVGDETSVPYIIRALRWMPEGGGLCTWSHGLRTLNWITNHSPGYTQAAWTRWYAENKHLSRDQWWADGFTTAGYRVSTEGGEQSTRSLLKLLGPIPEEPRWLSINAIRTLATYEPEDVQRVMANVLREGSAQERRGLARYAGKLDRVEAEAILDVLLQDEQRSVRLRASKTLCQRQLEWLKNPPGSIKKWHGPGKTSEDEFFVPRGRRVVTARTPLEHRVPTTSAPHPLKYDLVPVPDEGETCDWPPCFIWIDEQEPDRAPSTIVYFKGITPANGEAVYSTALPDMYSCDVSQIASVRDPEFESAYVSVPDYTCRVDVKTGRIAWEIGFGTDDRHAVSLLEDYLVIYLDGGLVVCDAVRGGILAHYDLAKVHVGDRITLVDGRLRVTSYDGQFYVIELPTVENEERAVPANRKM